MWREAAFVLVGAVAGVASGLVGIGGGLVMVPVLVFFFGFSQHQAQGTTLAMMIPPIGLGAVIVYYRAGFVDLKTAALLCVGFVVGGFLGARMATHLGGVALERVFGAACVAVGIKMLIAR